MTCRRCGGCQCWSHFQSWGGTSAAWEYDGWLCLNCGEVVDPLILLNRTLQKQFQSGLPGEIPARPYEGRILWVSRREDIVA
jgi:hypothetical protein